MHGDDLKRMVRGYTCQQVKFHGRKHPWKDLIPLQFEKMDTGNSHF